MKQLLILGLICLSNLAQARVNGIASVEANITKTDSVQIELVNPVMQYVTGGQVLIADGQLTMSLKRPTPACPPDSDCAITPAAPVVIQLQIVSVEFSNCGDTYTAETPSSLNGLNRLHETVRLVDMSEALCDLPVEGYGRVEYIASESPEKSGGVYFKIDQLNKK